jgi:hypothetical protein
MALQSVFANGSSPGSEAERLAVEIGDGEFHRQAFMDANPGDGQPTAINYFKADADGLAEHRPPVEEAVNFDPGQPPVAPPPAEEKNAEEQINDGENGWVVEQDSQEE